MDYRQMSPEELVRACLQKRDESAWLEFIRRFHPVITGVAFRVARRWGKVSPQEVDDLVQETYLKICTDATRLLENFKSAHKDAIYGYIKVFTANLVQDHFKALSSKKRGGEAVVSSVEIEESSNCGQNPGSNATALNRILLIQQIEACLRSIATGPNAQRDQRIFWLYYRVGLAASEIAVLPTIGLNVKGVESTLFRLNRQVRARLVPRSEEASDTYVSEKGIRQGESF
jgi:RNA polymerase sigma-70 factor (ECF subfamily)